MIKEVIMPKLGETMEEGKIARWHKKEGDYVEKEEILFEVVTDKATFEVESPYSGYVKKILYPAGDTPIKVTTVIAYIVDNLEEELPVQTQATTTVAAFGAVEEKTQQARLSTTVESAEVKEDRIKISPAARKLAEEHNIDITMVKGTGPGGRITKEDIENIISERAAAQQKAPAQEIPLSHARKIISQRMTYSKQTIPHYYLVAEINMSSVGKLRSAIVNKYGANVTPTDFIIKAVALSLAEYPLLNSHFDPEREIIKQFSQVNIGIAVGLEDILVVPVILDVVGKNIVEISKERLLAVGRARERKVTLEEMNKGTFTISNLGMYEIDEFAAIINPPQVGILAIGKISERLYVSEGKMMLSSLMRVTLSADHRVVDGLYGAKFLKRLKELLEVPEVLVKELDL
jgi:pyruvate dehydrogenase E2 component (dihydrolipoamide acetyltransferase)